ANRVPWGGHEKLRRPVTPAVNGTSSCSRRLSAGAGDGVGGTEGRSSQTFGKIRVPCQKIPDHLSRRRRAVSSDSGIRPALGKEDIAGALDLGQQFQARTNESQRLILP